MTDLSEAIFGALSPLLAGKVFAGTFPQPFLSSPEWPAIRYQFVSARRNGDLCGSDQETDDQRFQVDVVAVNYQHARALKEQVSLALAVLLPPPIEENERNLYDGETHTHRCAVDFLFYPSSD